MRRRLPILASIPGGSYTRPREHALHRERLEHAALAANTCHWERWRPRRHLQENEPGRRGYPRERALQSANHCVTASATTVEGVTNGRGFREHDSDGAAGSIRGVLDVVEMKDDVVAARLEIEDPEAVEGSAANAVAGREVQRADLAVERKGDAPAVA